MIKLPALVVIGAMTYATTAPQFRTPEADLPMPAYDVNNVATDVAAKEAGEETLAIYYSPLRATKMAETLGLGMAYHMGIVYTDRNGISYGATAIPSDFTAAQTPDNMLDAMFAMAKGQSSRFGTLYADPNNGKAFVKGSAADYFTHDPQGNAFPFSVVKRGRNLSAQFASIVSTYAGISKMRLTYSPLNQNSNSLAGTALRRVGIGFDVSSTSYFTPGAFTLLPVPPANVTTGKDVAA